MLVVSFILFCLPLLARPRMMTKVPAKPTENQDYFEKTKRGIRNLVSKSDVIITGRITKFYHSRQKTNGLEVGGVAFDVEVEKVLLGENLPKQLHKPAWLILFPDNTNSRVNEKFPRLILVCA